MAYVLGNLSARSWILCHGPYNTYIAIVSYYYCISEYIKKMGTATLSHVMQT